MTDTEAIALYVAAGNPREDWAALDDRDRYPWRKMALERISMKPAMICKGGIYPNPEEEKPFATMCDHCDRDGIDLILFGDQDCSIEGAYAFVCEDCLTEALAILKASSSRAPSPRQPPPPTPEPVWTPLSAQPE
jgi:hypothetical protein